MPETSAWLLSISDSIQFCIAEHEAEAYINDTEVQVVPLTSDYCRHVIFWQDKILPVIELDEMIDKKVKDNDTASNFFKHIFITVYQTEENAPLEYIAFKLSSAPEKMRVNDDNICDVPDDYPECLKPHLLSIFNHNDKITSIFDIASISQV